MNNQAITLVSFIIGAAIGSIVTWQYVKKKYEQLAQEEINSVKEVFSKKETPLDNGDNIRINTAYKVTEKPDISAYAAKLNNLGYTNYSDSEKVKAKEIPEIDSEEEEASSSPYVISPENFGEFEDYETISLTYYADQVLTDEVDEEIDDVDNTVGLDSLSHFGEYEDDSVFVRNDNIKCDYEILLDRRKYSDVINTKPHQVEG